MIRLTEEAMRDGNQSLVASRIRTEDLLPVAPKIDRVGYSSADVWSGSIFECCLRFLNEDPWERLGKLKEAMPRTPLKTLVRGQNLMGFRNYSDDTVYRFVKSAVAGGIRVFSIFDSLNDTRNMEVPIRAVKRERGIAEAHITYVVNPLYTISKWVEIARKLESFGSDVFCIVDTAGIMSPRDAFDLVSRVKAEIRIPVCLHFHCTTGMALMSYLEGCRAGAEILDTCISPLSGGKSLPPTEGVVSAFRGTKYDTGYDLNLLDEIREYFSNLWEKYLPHYNRRLFEIDLGSFLHKLPSGMLSHLIFQLNEMKAGEKYEAVLKEVPSVIEDLGYPPLATPSSQIVAVQAAMNVITGERYKLIPAEVKNYVRGMYGKPPGEISEEVKEKALGKNWKEEIITGRPADYLADEFPKAEEEVRSLGVPPTPENVLTYIFYPKAAKDFWARK